MGSPLDDIVAGWRADEELGPLVAHVEDVPERRPILADLEPAPPRSLGARLMALGIERLYRHQVQAIHQLRAGIDTVVVAGTAAGKSLCYQVPIAEAVLADPATRALAVYPTKALAQDQLRAFHRLDVAEMVTATYDGDTDPEQRRWIRRGAAVVLSNPDMLHIGILPNHERWADFLHHLRYVVVDEVHMLRGIFGSNVAHVLRRLLRVAAHYGARPTFAFTSATIGNPGELATGLLGRPVEVVAGDASPAGAKRFVLWNPPLEDDGETRASSLGEVTARFADLVGSDVRTIAFSRSRKATELIYRWARDRLDPDRAARISPYRGGYLPEERRRIEAALFDGSLLGVTATNALELGIDVSGLDAAVINTFPGTIASFRQQAGRAGRTRADSLAVLVAGQDALDQYYMTHPDQLFSREPEAAVINPDNPRVLAAHLRCAAHELPLVPADRRWFGDDMEEAVTALVAADNLRVREGKAYSTSRRAPAAGVNIRSSGGPTYTLVDLSSGEPLGTIEESRAHSQAHPGAVYLHQGDSYLVERLDRSQLEVRVRRGEVGYYTQPKEDKHLAYLDVAESSQVGHLGAYLGTVEVESRMVGFRRKSIATGEILGTEPLDLPPSRLVTQAFWFTVPDDLYAEAGIGWQDVPGTLHAAEHTTIAMLPLFAICDRWDVGGLSTAVHEQTGGGVYFVYDGYDGGAGVAPIGFAAGERLLRATLEAVRRCPCTSGCPSCVQSPKCGNFNDPLDKHGAARLLTAALGQ